MTDSVPDIETLAALVAASLNPTSIEASDGASRTLQRIIPAGWTIRETDLERMEDQPRSTRVATSFADPASFGRYVGHHVKPDSQAWIDLDAPTQATAVIDGHHFDAQWETHRASLTLRPDPLFLVLCEMHKLCEGGRSYGQVEFARAIERLGSIIANPTHSILRTLVDTLRATSAAEVVSSGVTHNGGRSVAYKQTTSVRSGKTGDVEFPSSITFVVPPWFGVPAVSVEMQVLVSVAEGERPAIDVLIPRLDDVRRDGVNLAVLIASNAAQALPSETFDPTKAAPQVGATLSVFGDETPLYYGTCKPTY